MIDGQAKWGLLAEAVMAGYVAGCTIEGGTIRIGEQKDGSWAFEVDDAGNVSMLGGAVKFTSDTNSLNESYNKLNNRINETNATIERTSESIEAEVTRAESVESQLRSSIKINADSITSKVERDDFGTMIEQNYDHVKIAWNNNSKYISFKGGSLNIYEAETQSDDTLLMKQTYTGAWYYRDGATVGHVGSARWANDSTFKGLLFNLESGGDYMCWAYREQAGDDTFTTKLIYYANNRKEKAGLHLECDTYTNGNLYLSHNHRVRIYSDDSIGYDGGIDFLDPNSSVYLRMDHDERGLKIFNDSKLMIYNNVQTDIHSNVYMHNYKIYDSTIATSSDARLKTNIQDTQVNALDTIMQIDMKEFDWIESGEHEDLGMIAQQVQTVAPELVDEDPKTGKLSIKTTKFIPYLIKAVQELYESSAMSIYSLRRSTWSDKYSLEDKEAFVNTLASSNELLENTPKIEVVHEPIVIPVNEQKENINEQ
jgi:hypothetical protein